MEQDIDYHRQRARRELDLGLTAPSLKAARAHLRLAALHFEQLRSLSGVSSERPLLAC
ncbi:hypothetical protein [Sphingomonas ginkgonis]|uniref:hypothetical protein n=1 Tax=Sphingomonas ginkgonis TaxID=2315330 RepID=UPI00163A01F7|nr:hypothetical protein [Sphingomonas ginkgonis]